MKKGVKVLIIVLVLAIVGLISYIAVDKLILSKDDGKNSEKVASNEVKNDDVGTNESTGDKIYAEILKKEKYSGVSSLCFDK